MSIRDNQEEIFSGHAFPQLPSISSLIPDPWVVAGERCGRNGSPNFLKKTLQAGGDYNTQHVGSFIRLTRDAVALAVWVAAPRCCDDSNDGDSNDGDRGDDNDDNNDDDMDGGNRRNDLLCTTNVDEAVVRRGGEVVADEVAPGLLLKYPVVNTGI